MAITPSVEARFSEAMMSPDRGVALLSNLVGAPGDLLALMRDWLCAADLTLSLEDSEASLSSAAAGKEGFERCGTLVQSFFALESLRRALGWAPDKFIDFLADRFDDEARKAAGQPFSSAKRECILALFVAPAAQVDLLYKARRLYDGSLPSFVESRTTVDFRPVFSEDMGISRGVIATVLELIARKPDETAETERIAIQMDLEDINQLERELSRARDKIARLRHLLEAKEGVSLYNPKAGLQGEVRE